MLGSRFVTLFSGRVSPSTILRTKLAAWWTADRTDLLTVSGAEVTSWKDVVGGYDMVQAVSASRPLYSPTGFNGAPCITADGTDDEMTSTDAALLAALPSGAAPGEIWSVCSQDALVAETGTRTLAGYGEASTNVSRQIRRAISGTNVFTCTMGTGATNVTAIGGGGAFDGRKVARGEFLAAEVAGQLDSGPRGTPVAGVPATINARVRLFAAPLASAGNFFKGSVRDVIFTKADLTADEANALLAWALPRRMP